jgi:hypothetical protein
LFIQNLDLCLYRSWPPKLPSSIYVFNNTWLLPDTVIVQGVITLKSEFESRPHIFSYMANSIKFLMFLYTEDFAFNRSSSVQFNASPLKMTGTPIKSYGFQ